MTRYLPDIVGVGIGGALGSMSRYSLSGLEIGTLLVNILGSFVFALLAAFFATRHLPSALRLGLTTGFLGGFTTHSAFMVETLTLDTWPAFGYLAATLIGGMTAVLVGTVLGRRIWSQ